MLSDTQVYEYLRMLTAMIDSVGGFGLLVKVMRVIWTQLIWSVFPNDGVGRVLRFPNRK